MPKMATLKETVNIAQCDWILSILNDPTFERHWNWYSLSKNPQVTWDIVQANPDKQWDWGCLSRNPNITWDIVQANPDKPWDWRWLSRNPNVLRYPLAEMERTAWHFIAAWRIQRAFKKAYSNPEYKMCRDRLMCEFAGMAKDLET